MSRPIPPADAGPASRRRLGRRHPCPACPLSLHGAAACRQSDPGPPLDEAHFVFGEAAMAFDLHDFLLQQAPHLLPKEEVILHWSGITSLNPSCCWP